jgi:hypothetical protein
MAGEQRVQDEQGNTHVFPAEATPDMISQAMGLQPARPDFAQNPPSMPAAPNAILQDQARATQATHAAGPYTEPGAAEAGMGFGRPMSQVAKDSARAVVTGANYAAPIMTGGMSLPAQMLTFGTTGAGQTATEGGSAKDIAGSALVNMAIPPIAEGVAAGGRAAMNWARGPVAENIPRALHMAPGSAKMGQALKDVEGARPYLGGDRPTLADVQQRIPAAKAEVWEPYQKAVDLVKDHPTSVTNPATGQPMTVGEIEAERVKLSEQTRQLKSAKPTDKQALLQREGDLANMAAREKEIQAALDEKLSSTGIDPKAIRRVHGNIKGIERQVSGRVADAEKLQPYGIGKMVPKWAGGPGFHPIEGAKDIVAGRPLVSGKPSDVAMRQLFREGGAKPNFGEPIRPVSGGSGAGERGAYIRPIMTGEPGEPVRPSPAPDVPASERRSAAQTKADIQRTSHPSLADLDRQWRERAAEFTRRREALGPLERPSTERTPPPGEDVRAERFYEKYGKR